MARNTNKAKCGPAGDLGARFGERLAQIEEPVRRFARGQIGPELRMRVDTDEVVQVARVRGAEDFHKKPELARMEDNEFQAWMKWLIRERVIPDLVKHHQAAKRNSAREVHLDTKAKGKLIDHRAPTPSEELKKAEDRAKLDAALKVLTPREREIVRLHIEGKASKEIGGILGIETASASVQLCRGLKKLRENVHQND